MPFELTCDVMDGATSTAACSDATAVAVGVDATSVA